MQKLQICFVSQQYGDISNGPGAYTTNLINYLSKEGHDITVICPARNCEVDQTGVNFIPIKALEIEYLRHANWVTLAYAFAKKLKSLDIEKFDIIHFTEAKQALFYSTKKTRVIGTQHDYLVSLAKRNPFRYRKFYPYDWMKRYFYYNTSKILEKRALGKLDKIITVCKASAQPLTDVYHIPKEKIEVIYNGINTKEYSDKKNVYTIKYSRPIILFIGGNFQGKGLPTIIKASPSIVKKFPKATFLIIGKDPHGKIMEKLCEKYNVRNHFQFLGRQKHEKIAEFYQMADLFTIVSSIESFAIVFLEAMAAGTPVIGGNVGGTVELIQNKKNGFLVNPFDSRKLSEYIIRLLKDNSLREQIINEGRKTVQKFSIEQMGEQHIKCYGEIINKKKYI